MSNVRPQGVTEIVPLLSSRGYCTILFHSLALEEGCMAMGAYTSMSSCFHLHKEVFARLNRETAEADTVNCSLAKGHSDLCFDAHVHYFN